MRDEILRSETVGSLEAPDDRDTPTALAARAKEIRDARIRELRASLGFDALSDAQLDQIERVVGNNPE